MRDASGGSVAGADVSLFNAQQAVLGSTRTDAQGRFAFEAVPPGSYLLRVTSPRFAERRVAVRVEQSDVENIEVSLALEPVHEEITVSADTGLVEDSASVS